MVFKETNIFEQTFDVSVRVYDGFLELFNDRNPLHTEEKFALDRGFKSKVMHGNILNGFISYFVGECLPIKNVVIHSQEIQFKNPIYLNDKLFFKAKVSDIFESVNAVEFKFTFVNNSAKTVAKGKIQIGILS
jgi:3-hydroxybutyryl-CoA dehydratase